MLQRYGYYFTPDYLIWVEHLPNRAQLLDRRRARIDRLNQRREARGRGGLRPTYSPPGPLYDDRLRNPEDFFLFGAEAQEVEPVEPAPRRRRRRKAPSAWRRIPKEEQEAMFGTPVEFPDPAEEIHYKNLVDYRRYMNYFRGLTDARLNREWEYVLKRPAPFTNRLGMALREGLRQAMVERGLIGDEGMQLDQIVFHGPRQNPGRDRRVQGARRSAVGGSAAEALQHAILLARSQGIDPYVYHQQDDVIHRLGESPSWTVCGIGPAMNVWTIDAPFERWLALPYRQPLDALRLCPGCIAES
jgi:hypothetical protein